jgi:hypothetical protein
LDASRILIGYAWEQGLNEWFKIVQLLEMLVELLQILQPIL